MQIEDILKLCLWFLGILECVKSYGENCQYPCSQHCINQTCDRFIGTCLSWCQERFYGQKCNHGNFGIKIIDITYLSVLLGAPIYNVFYQSSS